MNTFKLWPFYGQASKDLIWIRATKYGFGVAVKRTKKLFSERNGYIKTIPLPFGWRIQWLKGI